MAVKYLKHFGLLLLKLLLGFCFVAPFYIAVIYSVKSKQEIIYSRLSFPKTIHWENFTRGMEVSNFIPSLKNSVITTVACVVILTVICSMAAYMIARKNTKTYNFIYYLFLGAMIIPFQTILTPLYFDMKTMGLINSLFGFILVKSGFLIAFTVLIITGFVKTIPRELEEAGKIDGSGLYGVFWRIVFPLMRPVILTSVVLNALGVWNDFQVSLAFLQRASVRTIPLTQYHFFGERSTELGLAFAVFIISMIPILILFLTLQKYIINGITAGAIKG